MKAGRRGWESPGALLPELGHGGLWAPPPPTKHSPSPAPACCVGKVPGFLGGDLLPALLSQLLRTRWRLGQHLSSPGTSAPASLSRSFLVSVSILSQHPNPRLDPVVGGSWGGGEKGAELVAWTLAGGGKLSTCWLGRTEAPACAQGWQVQVTQIPLAFLRCPQLPGHSGFHGHTLPLHHVPGS